MMAKHDEFDTNLLRLVCASNFFLASMTASREMYGKSYFALGAMEKQTLDQAVLNSIVGNFHALVPGWFGAPTPAPTGFQTPANPPDEP
jgi:hypothetical protein